MKLSFPMKALALCSVVSFHSFASAAPEISLSAMLDSKYVAEGRDNLSEGGIISYEGTASWENGVTVGSWFANSTDSDEKFNEWIAFAEYGFTAGAVDAYVAYAYHQFIDDHEDNEYGVGFSLNNLPITSSIDYRYSQESDGGFLEITLSKDFEMSSGITLTPYVMQGLDYGWSSDERDGENNTQLGLNASKMLADNVEVSAHLNHSIAGKDVKNDGLGDETWGGVGITFTF